MSKELILILVANFFLYIGLAIYFALSARKKLISAAKHNETLSGMIRGTDFHVTKALMRMDKKMLTEYPEIYSERRRMLIAIFAGLIVGFALLIFS